MRDVTRAEVAAEPEPAPEEEKSIEELMEERRKRRAAILAKHASGQSSDNLGLSARAATPITTTTTTAAAESALGTPSAAVGAAFAKVSLASEAGKMPTRIGTASPAPLTAGLGGTFALAKEDDDGIKANESAEVRKGEQVKAADYDPSLDRREDEKKRFHPDEAMVVDDAGEEEEVEVTDDEGEEEDVDDMFALAMGDEEEEGKKEKKVGKKKKVVKRKKAPTALANTAVTVDSAADPEGYYTIILGEYLDGGRYQVYSSLGKGMFANVVRARVLRDEFGREIDPAAAAAQGGFRDVAIKIVRCQEAMYKAGLKEAQILQKLRNMDLEDKKHVVRLERTFEHRGHLCLVFENLRCVVKRFGKDVGLNIRAVRAYANQLFLALSLLKKANVMHADIKPDNILVNEQKNLLKLCDLGSASDASENEVTPYLVSRFYRAPEIILGVPYDPSLDIWSVGCTLYELYTGKILFPGKSNAHMLMLMMEVKGRFNQKMIKRARFGERYFDGLGNLLEDVIKDVGVGVGGVGVGGVGKLGGGAGGGVKGKDLRSRIVGASGSMGEEEGRLVGAFVDLLEKCLVLDPGRRITPREALGHAFVRG
ncbi:CMGC/DYRK/PRP4 protein kinase [Ephemerocybe angulata]|uniref:non-specific serine/threonine protein kinase n=1 Tax=Ephemerocybe angulata TaxID=980116 RepID=A0A8H6LS02_9AGAR|nr:CMGC/DYRK/PRP4 protein kinase [Tulosesus angulatus]